jgi:hypothetical protein
VIASRGSPARLASGVVVNPPTGTAASIGPDGPSASTASAVTWRAQGMRVAVPASRQPLPSARRVNTSPSRTGARLSGPSGTARPARASHQRASMVSPSGMGAAWAAAICNSRIASGTVAPKPPAASGSRAAVKPASATASHSACAKLPCSAARSTALPAWVVNKRSALSAS